MSNLQFYLINLNQAEGKKPNQTRNQVGNQTKMVGNQTKMVGNSIENLLGNLIENLENNFFI